jgi:hypothetical protein
VVISTVADEFYERYRKLRHDDLYRMLQDGSPRQLNSLADTWRGVEGAIESLATTLRRDLALLLPYWSGAGSREFQYRLGLIADYAAALADEAVALRTGLSVMSDALTKAQRLAEPGQEESPEWASTGVLGPALGHTAPEVERTKAYERMVLLVGGLAAEYALADHHNWPATLPVAPVGLPGVEAVVDPHAALASVDDVHKIVAAQPIGPTAVQDLAGTGLAGVSGLTGGVDNLITATPVSMVGHASPPTTLSGAGAALAGVSPHLVSSATYRGADATTTSGQSATPPMMGAALAHGGPAVGPATTDARLLDEAAAWSTGEKMAWSGDDEPPPAVIGDLTAPA